ncbi:MlaE family ABC transporter permease [Sciscionella marina]|uniref:MlaE family ABC transporter permease n=1 Tax=Sciscionella marina TaxID=508770 RepID=UPI0012F64004|nr:ABC transporter permease [Sciscionella marina]
MTERTDRGATAAQVSEYQVPEVGPPPPLREPSAAIVGRIPGPALHPVAEAGAMVQLLGRTAWDAIRRPIGYWGAVKDEIYRTLRLCWFPLILSSLTFCLLFAILALTLLILIGASNRYGQYFLIYNMRAFSPWINAMVVAGVVGASMTADLGARKIREELDAFVVLGIDPIRELVLPKILTAIVMTCLLNLVSVVAGTVAGLIGVGWVGQVDAGIYFATLFSNITPIEIALALFKSALFGVAIGVICSYKGINSRGGAIGVGRAVNQAVVLSFVVIFVIDFFFTTTMLGWTPSLNTAR